MPYVRRAAPEVIATATAQRWEPAEVLRVLLAEEATAPGTAKRRASTNPVAPLIRRTHRPGQGSRERDHRLAASRQPLHPQLTRAAIQRRRDHPADANIEGRPGLSQHGRLRGWSSTFAGRGLASSVR